MATQMLTVRGERFVVIPEKEYRLLKAIRTQSNASLKRDSKTVRRSSVARQNSGDAAEVRRRSSESVKSLDDVVSTLQGRSKSSSR